MTNVKTVSVNVKKNDFYDSISKHRTPELNLPCNEELSYRLDNVLKLTDDYQIIVYNNMIKISSRFKRSNPSSLVKDKARRIVSFSKNSRRNLSKHLCKIRFNSYSHRYFCTLTFHEVYQTNRAYLKNLVDRFNKVIKRFDDDLSFVWKLEFQKRGAPHLHYFILLKKYLSHKERELLSSRIREAWHRAVDDDNSSFLNCSVDLREVNNDNKAADYLLKYMSKLDDSENTFDVGRFWAVSSNLDENPLYVVNVDEHFYQNFRHILLLSIKEKFSIADEDFSKMLINTSFEIRNFYEDSLRMIIDQAKDEDKRYILAQLQNSPP